MNQDVIYNMLYMLYTIFHLFGLITEIDDVTKYVDHRICNVNW